MPPEQRDKAIAQLQMTAQVLWDRGQIQASYFCSAIAGDEIAPAPKPKPKLKLVD
jgi:hypothetical protein